MTIEEFKANISDNPKKQLDHLLSTLPEHHTHVEQLSCEDGSCMQPGTTIIDVRCIFAAKASLFLSYEDQIAILEGNKEKIKQLRSDLLNMALEAIDFGQGDSVIVDSPVACLEGHEDD